MQINNVNLQPLAKEFYTQDTITIAQKLLGKYIVRNVNSHDLIGKIVETEAYITGDPSSHAYRGEMPRNASMFLGAGIAYIYSIYGKYYCLNVVTNTKGTGEAVLIRALEPINGLSIMGLNRHTSHIQQLCKGPARLTMAMAITKAFDGHDLSMPPLMLMQDNATTKPEDIITTTRMGISQAQDLPLRFFVKDNSFVSRLQPNK